MLDQISLDSLDQLLTSVHAVTESPQLQPSWASLGHGDVVEMQGHGKTHFIYLLLLNCIIPCEHKSASVGGWNKAGIVFDMDGSFDIKRFNRLLLGRLKRLFPDDMHLAQAVAQRSLERLHIFRPTSSAQLAISLTQLGKYHATRLPDSAIGLVAIDSINAYHWPDRFNAEQARSSSLFLEQRKASNLTQPLLSIMATLLSLRTTHAPVIMLSNRNLQSTLHTGPLISTHHITLSPTSAPQSQGDMVVATGERRHEKEPTEKTEIMVSLRSLKCAAVDDFILHIGEEEVSFG